MCVRVVTTDHSNTSTRLQCHQQQQLRLRASEPWRLPAVAGKPRTCSGQDVFSFKFRTQVVVLHQQYHPVRKCNDLLIVRQGRESEATESVFGLEAKKTFS